MTGNGRSQWLGRAQSPTKSRMRVTPQQLDLAAKSCHDRIVARDGGEHGSFAHLDELWADPDLLRRMKVA